MNTYYILSIRTLWLFIEQFLFKAASQKITLDKEPRSELKNLPPKEEREDGPRKSARKQERGERGRGLAPAPRQVDIRKSTRAVEHKVGQHVGL